MSAREKQIQSEAQALWRELFDEPAPAEAGGELIEQMLSRLPTPGYKRLNSPFLRASLIAGPKGR